MFSNQSVSDSPMLMSEKSHNRIHIGANNHISNVSTEDQARFVKINENVVGPIGIAFERPMILQCIIKKSNG
jgi:hypothetical protein